MLLILKYSFKKLLNVSKLNNKKENKNISAILSLLPKLYLADFQFYFLKSLLK